MHSVGVPPDMAEHCLAEAPSLVEAWENLYAGGILCDDLANPRG